MEIPAGYRYEYACRCAIFVANSRRFLTGSPSEICAMAVSAQELQMRRSKSQATKGMHVVPPSNPTLPLLFPPDPTNGQRVKCIGSA